MAGGRHRQQEHTVKQFQRFRQLLDGGLVGDATAGSRFTDRSVWGKLNPVHLTHHEGPGTMTVLGMYSYGQYGQEVYGDDE